MALSPQKKKFTPGDLIIANANPILHVFEALCNVQSLRRIVVQSQERAGCNIVQSQERAGCNVKRRTKVLRRSNLCQECSVE